MFGWTCPCCGKWKNGTPREKETLMGYCSEACKMTMTATPAQRFLYDYCHLPGSTFREKWSDVWKEFEDTENLSKSRRECRMDQLLLIVKHFNSDPHLMELYLHFHEKARRLC